MGGQPIPSRGSRFQLETTGGAPACTCCAGLGTMQKAADKRGGGGYRLESTSGYAFNSPTHFQSLEGCNDYQLFWD